VKWPPWRKQHRVPPPPVPDRVEATEVRAREEQGLKDLHEDRRHIDHLVDALRRHRETNHFAELLGEAFGRRT
jgi:hypothetical protein